MADDEIINHEDFKIDLQNLKTAADDKAKAELLQQYRRFFNLYQNLKNHPNRRNFWELLGPSIGPSQYSYPWVFKILDSDHYMIWDGHHRLVCKYVMGERFVKARIVGVKKNGLQAADCGVPDIEGC